MENKELKTLKDMKTQVENLIDGKRYPCVSSYELKAEAVKWVKFIAGSKAGLEFYEKYFLTSWIKHFFNLTEEDLK